METAGTTRPADGTVERYAVHMRNRVCTRTEVAAGRLDRLALAWIETVTVDGYLDGDELRVRIRNVLAAAKLMADEIGQRDGS